MPAALTLTLALALDLILSLTPTLTPTLTLTLTLKIREPRGRDTCVARGAPGRDALRRARRPTHRVGRHARGAFRADRPPHRTDR